MPTIVSIGQITISDQKNPAVAVLSNAAVSVTTDANGGAGDYSYCVTTMRVLLGSADNTGDWVITAAAGPGVTGALTSSTYQVNDLSMDSGYVDFTASRAGYDDLTARFSISKSRRGVAGQSLTIVPSHQGFSFTDGAPTPPEQTLSLTVLKKDVTGGVVWFAQDGVVITADPNESGAASLSGFMFGTGGAVTGEVVYIDVSQLEGREQVVVTALCDGVTATHVVVRLDSSTAAAGANKTSIDASGKIQGVESGAGTPVNNANIGITEDGQLLGAGPGQVSLTHIPGVLQADHLRSLTMAADSRITAGTDANGVMLDANTQSLLVVSNSKDRVRLGYHDAMVNGENYGMVVMDAEGDIMFDSRNNVGIVGNKTYDNYNLGDGSTNPDWDSDVNGVSNIAIGACALQADGLAKTTGRSYNVAIGSNAMRYSNSTGNIGIGNSALKGDVSGADGADNIAIGYNAMRNYTVARQNVALGKAALSDLNSGEQNTALGHNALMAGVNSSYNVGVGFEALLVAQGYGNVSVGHQSGCSVTTGDNNTFVGRDAGFSVTEGSGNTFIGYRAGWAEDVNDTTIIASGAGEVLKHNGVYWETASDFIMGGDLSVAKGLKVSGVEGLGYNYGGAVTQATSRNTGVTLDTPSGTITLFSRAITAGTLNKFTLTNSCIAATDVVMVGVQEPGSGTFSAFVNRTAAGACDIVVQNLTTVAAAQAVLINFAIIKGANA